jgi:hypothetical protein
MLRKLTRIDKRSVLLAMGMFWNPFGFDAAFAVVMEWTGSYWVTDAIFYGISLSCFGLYFWSGRRSRKGGVVV